MKRLKTFSIATPLVCASVVALLCAGFIIQTTATSSSEANLFQVVIWQRETQTLVMMGIYFAALALFMVLGKLVLIKKHGADSIPPHD